MVATLVSKSPEELEAIKARIVAGKAQKARLIAKRPVGPPMVVRADQGNTSCHQVGQEFKNEIKGLSGLKLPGNEG